MFITDPDFLYVPDSESRIPDPTTAPKEEGDKNFFVLLFLSTSHKYHKIVNNFIFEQVKKIILTKTLRILVLFTQKFVSKLSKYGFGIRDRDLGPNTFSRSRIQGQKGTGFRIRIRNNVCSDCSHQ